MAGVTPEGFVRKTESELVTEMTASARAKISPSLDADADSVVGNILQISASKHAENWEAIEETYNSNGPGASGAALDRECSITGTKRNKPTFSEVTATVNVNPGSYAAGTIAATVVDNPNARFVSTAAVVNITGSPASRTVAMRADTSGKVRALAGTLTNLDAPPAGVNSIMNFVDADEGDGVEQDPALRIRRKRELADPGQTTLPAMRAALSKVGRGTPGTPIDQFVVYTNRTASVDADGRDPKCFEVVTLGGVANEIAQVLLDNSPLGISSFGSSTGTAVDDEGNDQTISYSEATALRLYARVTLVTEALYGGDAAVQQVVADFTDGSLTVLLSDGSELSGEVDIGGECIPARIAAAVQAMGGVKSVTSVELSTDGVSWSTAIRDLTARQYLGNAGSRGIQTADVTVVAT